MMKRLMISLLVVSLLCVVSGVAQAGETEAITARRIMDEVRLAALEAEDDAESGPASVDEEAYEAQDLYDDVAEQKDIGNLCSLCALRYEVAEEEIGFGDADDNGFAQNEVSLGDQDMGRGYTEKAAGGIHFEDQEWAPAIVCWIGLPLNESALWWFAGAQGHYLIAVATFNHIMNHYIYAQVQCGDIELCTFPGCGDFEE